MQQYDVTVSNTNPFVVNAAGRYIKYVSGNNGGGDVSLIVTPGNAGATKTVLVPGQALRLGPGSATPSAWILTNAAGGATITGKVVIGDGQIDDPTINGTVSIIDGSKARSLGLVAFTVNALAGAPVAAQYSRLQLWNPANSGKRLVIESLTGAPASGTEGIFASFTQVQLANAQGAGLAKVSGGANSSAGLTYQDTTAQAFGSAALASIQVTAGQNSAQVKPVEPYVLLPGWGLLLTAGAVNLQFGCIFEWYEEPNV